MQGRRNYVAKLVSELSCVKLRTLESNTLLRTLSDIDLPDRIKVLLHDVFNANTDTCQVRCKSDATKAHPQKHNYLTAKNWAVLCASHCMDLCVKTLLRRCALIGLRHPSEHTMFSMAKCVRQARLAGHGTNSPQK